MSGQLPYLDVRGPDGYSARFELNQDGIRIGRLPDLNDVALQPDPQRLVTRRAHCTLEHDKGAWSVVTNPDANPISLRRGQMVQVVTGRFALADGDIICVIAREEPGQDRVYWELTFRDPQKTYRLGAALPPVYLQYDAARARLFRASGGELQEITNLRPQEHKLIRHMAQRNQASGGVPVLCTYDELIKAIWGDEINHTESEINHLVWELRQKLEPREGTIQFLQLVRGLGYRLESR
jgi:hypothetical protein